jgi:hypothetical protein
MATDDLVLEPEAIEQLDGLAVLPRGDVDHVPRVAQALDDRSEYERMRRRGAVDPDPHVPKLTGRPAGLIGWGPNKLRGGVPDG